MPNSFLAEALRFRADARQRIVDMVQPTPEQLALLGWRERLFYKLGDLYASRLRFFSPLWVRTVGSFCVWAGVCRRIQVQGLDQFTDEHRYSRLMLVANHRSFFDFYVIAWVLLWRTQMPTRYFFPVRSTFFYERLPGALINFVITGMAMFPPVMRDRKKAAFNSYSLARMKAEMKVPGTLLGIHPEGTRNKDPNPWTFLKAQGGVGAIALTVEGVRTIPVFIMGVSNNTIKELWYNWVSPKKHPIYIRFGPEVQLDDLRAEADAPGVRSRAAERCMEAVSALAQALRAELGT